MIAVIVFFRRYSSLVHQSYSNRNSRNAKISPITAVKSIIAFNVWVNIGLGDNSPYKAVYQGQMLFPVVLLLFLSIIFSPPLCSLLFEVISVCPPPNLCTLPLGSRYRAPFPSRVACTLARNILGIHY